MAPSAAPNTPQNGSSRPAISEGEPRTYPVKEVQFEGFVAPQEDGYRKAQQLGAGNVAIVIDNGMSP
jgi:actin-related protein 5